MVAKPAARPMATSNSVSPTITAPVGVGSRSRPAPRAASRDAAWRDARPRSGWWRRSGRGRGRRSTWSSPGRALPVATPEQRPGVGRQPLQRRRRAGVERRLRRAAAGRALRRRSPRGSARRGAASAPRGRCGASAAIASCSDRPTTPSTASRAGVGCPAAAKAPAIAARIRCWLSISVPSTSKTTRRGVGHAQVLERDRRARPRRASRRASQVRAMCSGSGAVSVSARAGAGMGELSARACRCSLRLTPPPSCAPQPSPGFSWRAAAVLAVADDRMADRGHVGAELVGAAGHRAAAPPRRRAGRRPRSPRSRWWRAWRPRWRRRASGGTTSIFSPSPPAPCPGALTRP